VRDSDPDAALYWLGRMLDGGEDPLYIARRVIRMAVEDIGMADPQALAVTIAAQQAVHFLGQPEGDLALAQAVVYLSQAPKSNAIYSAYGAAMQDVKKTRNEPVPLHLRNAPTGLMQTLGYGQGYEYAHDLPSGRSEQAHLPPNLEGRIYYEPTERGFEAQVRERLAWRLERTTASPPRTKSRPDTGPEPATAAENTPGGAASVDPQALAGEESQEVEEVAASPPQRKGRKGR
jgi:putative ATPase